MWNRIRHPSPAMVVAMIALFFALGGAAGAVTAVPLAKRALSADNAKKLSGKTLDQVVDQGAAEPGPALVATRVGTVTLPADQGAYVEARCEAGERAVSGGYRYAENTLVLALDTFPKDDTTWGIVLANAGPSSASISVYVSCVAAPGTLPAYGRAQASVEAVKQVRAGELIEALQVAAR